MTPNKKANSGPLTQYARLRRLGRKLATHYLYETTVGAGLPVIGTLREFIETGDRIISIEGVFSGTLAYGFNAYDGSVPFSRIVADARERGYTEPDPRDDLAGTDVARKVVILGREMGLGLELDLVGVESLVPESLRSCPTAEEFLDRLGEFDADMQARLDAAKARGEALRYVGVVDPSGESQAELRSYPLSHPFAQLTGSDNIIAFRTARYDQQPLIVRGPGAGPKVTAGGVFADLLRLAAYLGAPT